MTMEDDDLSPKCPGDDTARARSISLAATWQSEPSTAKSRPNPIVRGMLPLTGGSMGKCTNLAAGCVFLTLAAGIAVSAAAESSDLGFAQRLRAQEAIERFYYSHQTGATRPFEQVFTRERLERKVRTYLEQSVALEQIWGIPVTAEMLRNEVERMARHTRLPQRLLELYAILEYDPVLVQECLVRPALVDRLIRDRFAFDDSIHAEPRRQAEALRQRLLDGSIDPFAEQPERAVIILARGSDVRRAAATPFADTGRVVLDADEFDRVRLIAAHAELALHNAERFDHAKERAFIDDVTEVYNARYLIKATEREIQRAERYGKDLCVLFLDLDRFKLVNDRFGHLIGSRTLRRLGEVLLQCIRQVDTLARFGGDEFTILLVDTDLEAGLVIAERIRRTVGETLFEGGPGAPIRLSISIGVATYPLHRSDREGLLDLSDKAMYRAKSLGRNCVCSASDLND